MKLNSAIFRRYDYRGIYPKEFDEKTVNGIGRAFGTFLAKKKVKKCFAGRDNRASSESLYSAFVEGLRSTGTDVVDIGVSSMPLLFHSLALNRGTGGAMITASHNPAEHNGVKLYLDNNPLFEGQLAEVSDNLRKDNFLSGSGSLTAHDFFPDYERHMKKFFKIRKKVRVVVDAGNGVSGKYLPKLLRGLGCEVIELFCEPDGSFPNHLPDPHREKYYGELKRIVVEKKADLGVATDGDADRAGFVDNTGLFITGNVTNLLLIRELLSRRQKGAIVCDVRSSLALFEEVKRLGGVAIPSRPGRTYIHEEMLRHKADFGCEVTGHISFKENGGNDDSYFVAARMCEIIASSGKSLSKLVSELPSYYSPPEIRLPYPAEKKEELVAKARADFIAAGYAVNSLEGVKVELSDAWGLLRTSSEPEITLIFEGKSEAALKKVYALFAAVLEKRGFKIPAFGKI